MKPETKTTGYNNQQTNRILSRKGLSKFETGLFNEPVNKRQTMVRKLFNVDRKLYFKRASDHILAFKGIHR